MIKGFITGSFRPFHKGHEALIDYAKTNCDELTIFITTLPDETIPYKYRLKWVLSTYLDDPKVTIVSDTINEPNLTGDALSIWWGFYIKNKYGNFDRVFTSENYGYVFAESMGATHYSFNFDRTNIPISATKIRKKPITNWDYLNNFAKDFFVKKIAIIGTESTGKTVLCKHLAKHYNTSWAPEAGDEIVSNTNDAKDIDIIRLIGKEHAKNIIKHTRQANKVLFVDTDMNITKSYAKFLCDEDVEFEPWINKANEIDLYIHLDSSAPFVQNGRRLENNQRLELEKFHLKQFELANIEFKTFSFKPVTIKPRPKHYADIVNRHYNERTDNIINYIDLFLSKY